MIVAGHPLLGVMEDYCCAGLVAAPEGVKSSMGDDWEACGNTVEESNVAQLRLAVAVPGHMADVVFHAHAKDVHVRVVEAEEADERSH